jgi:hypothetical protein
MRGLMLATMLMVAGTADAGAWAIVGSGGRSCRDWTSDGRAYGDGPVTAASQNALQEMSWVLGFLTGVDFIQETTATI